jgi:hypothetical protein
VTHGATNRLSAGLILLKCSGTTSEQFSGLALAKAQTRADRGHVGWSEYFIYLGLKLLKF